MKNSIESQLSVVRELSAPAPLRVQAECLADYDWVDTPDNPVFRALILPTVRRMKEMDCRRLTVELRGSKILFEALPVNRPDNGFTDLKSGTSTTKA